MPNNRLASPGLAPLLGNPRSDTATLHYLLVSFGLVLINVHKNIQWWSGLNSPLSLFIQSLWRHTICVSDILTSQFVYQTFWRHSLCFRRSDVILSVAHILTSFSLFQTFQGLSQPGPRHVTLSLISKIKVNLKMPCNFTLMPSSGEVYISGMTKKMRKERLVLQAFRSVDHVFTTN